MIQTQKLTTQQIGKLGELLVQYRLLSFGIESAHLTTDSGIDLIAYAPSREPVTIQVKANLKPKPGGGKGKAALDWWVPENSPAKLFAFVDVSENRVWVILIALNWRYQRNNYQMVASTFTCTPTRLLNAGKIPAFLY